MKNNKNTNRIKNIREYEKRYHDNLYSTKKLGEKGSRLCKPIDSIIDSINYLTNKGIYVLDIGCGVGRHSIPIAKKIQSHGGCVIGIDILDSAKIEFNKNKEKYGIKKNSLTFKKANIEDYKIEKESFDYIFAVSCIEHVKTENELKKVLNKISRGTKKGGINSFIISTDNTLFNPETNIYLDPMVETNLSKEEVDFLLNKYYGKRKTIEYTIKKWESKQEHTKEILIQKGNSIRVIYQKI